MGRGVSSGGGQSSLGYLFGNSEAPKSSPNPTPAENIVAPAENVAAPTEKPAAGTSPPAHAAKQIPAGIQMKNTNNYHRPEGQNTSNFITDRPSTKVHSAPGGGSSLDYLFGGNDK